MSEKPVGSFATLLLAIPLSAIPLMAIFGVPEFASLSASTQTTPPDIVRQPSMSFAGDDSSNPPGANDFRRRASDLLGSTGSPDNQVPAASAADQWTDLSEVQPADTAGQPGNGPANAGESVAPRPMQTAAVEPVVTSNDDRQPAAAPTQTPSGLTWREAARRLEDLDITNYRLERGHGSEGFLFVCLLSPGSDTRIIQRFEAEAAEPLEAVEDVLGQVENWLQNRYAENRSWIP